MICENTMPCLFAKCIFPSVCKNCQASHPYQLSLLRPYEHLSKIIATPWALAAHAATSALRAIKFKVKLLVCHISGLCFWVPLAWVV